MFEHILGMVIDIWGFHLQNQSCSLEKVEENDMLSDFLLEFLFWPKNTIKILLYKSGKNTSLSEIFTVFGGPNGTSCCKCWKILDLNFFSFILGLWLN